MACVTELPNKYKEEHLDELIEKTIATETPVDDTKGPFSDVILIMEQHKRFSMQNVTVKASLLIPIPVPGFSPKCSHTLRASIRYELNLPWEMELPYPSPPYIFGLRKYIFENIDTNAKFDMDLIPPDNPTSSGAREQMSTGIVVRMSTSTKHTDIENAREKLDNIGDFLINTNLQFGKVKYILNPLNGIPKYNTYSINSNNFRCLTTKNSIQNQQQNQEQNQDKEFEDPLSPPTEVSTGGARRATATVTLPSTARGGIKRGDAKGWPQPKGGKVKVASVKNGGSSAVVEFTDGSAVTAAYVNRLKKAVRSSSGAKQVKFVGGG